MQFKSEKKHDRYESQDAADTHAILRRISSHGFAPDDPSLLAEPIVVVTVGLVEVRVPVAWSADIVAGWLVVGVGAIGVVWMS